MDRKTPGLAALAALVLGTAGADHAAAQGLYVGGRLGASFATFGGQGSEGLDEYRSGLAAGGLAGWRVHPSLAVEAELTWLQKGAAGTLQGFEEPLAVDLELDYLQVPVLVRVSVPTAAPVRPVLSAGAAVSFETRCRERTAPGELAATLGCEGSGVSGRRTMDWSLLLGLGAETRVGSVSLALDGRYDLGLVDLADLEAWGPRNRAFVAVAAARVPLRLP